MTTTMLNGSKAAAAPAPVPAPAKKPGFFAWMLDHVNHAIANTITVVVWAAMWVYGKVSGLLSGDNAITALRVAFWACVASLGWMAIGGTLPLVVKVVAAYSLIALLMGDAWSFFRGLKTPGGRAEASARFTLCLLVGMLTGGLLATAVFYKLACSDTGRFHLAKRWGDTYMS